MVTLILLNPVGRIIAYMAAAAIVATIAGIYVNRITGKEGKTK